MIKKQILDIQRKIKTVEKLHNVFDSFSMFFNTLNKLQNPKSLFLNKNKTMTKIKSLFINEKQLFKKINKKRIKYKLTIKQ